MSIQQSLDGHSFSAQGLSGEFSDGSTSVQVEILSAKTVLVPAECFSPELAASLLAAAGLPLASGQCAVYSRPSAEVVAVMAISDPARQAVTEQLGDRAQFTTPLLHKPSVTDAVVWLCRKPGLLYIKVYDLALQFAEVIPAETDTDILYLITRLEAAFTLSEYRLYLSGEDTKELKKLLGNRFLEIVCE